MAADGIGNLYIADRGNNTIRKIVVATGAVTTLAGSPGVSGSTDGAGSVARFSSPSGLSFDVGSNLFVTDGSGTIRKIVAATGVVATLAGTAGTTGSADGVGAAARFLGPLGIVSDGVGNLYVSENSIIRKVVISTAAVTTIAGKAANRGSTDGIGAMARFSSPFGVATDGSGNCYVGDYGNGTIRKVVLATGAVSTIAGAAGIPGSADGIGAAARFGPSYGLTADSSGNLFVADSFNNTIRKVVLATGAVSTIAGTAGMMGTADGIGAAARFGSPSSVAADNAGSLFVADVANNNIRQIVLSTGVVTTLVGATGMLSSPFGIAADGKGNLYVADTGTSSIRKVVIATGQVSTIAGTAGFVGSTDGVGPAARFRVPYGVTIDALGDVYVADTVNGTIRKIESSTANVSTVAGIARQTGFKPGPTPGRMNSPIGLAPLPGGGLVIVDNAENVVFAVR
jgi:sugar lactone lactonase YvrE